jgi:2-polyprenyl-6-methoxyphenol hydroxylase-like FAD-dependent oxidoreductase
MTINPDVVIIGGGPIGLWTATSIRCLTGKNVLVVEKYPEYKRADIRLKIDASSFAGTPDYKPLKDLAKQWGNRTVPIKEMEDKLLKCAMDAGVIVQKGTPAEPLLLQEQYPTAKLFIGADGAKSTTRKLFFNDDFRFNHTLQYIVQVQYLIKNPSKKDDGNSSLRALDSYTKQKFAGHLIIQSVKPKENGQSEVTLRIFMNKQTYEQMSDAVFSHPYYFETDLAKVPAALRETLIRWWGAQKNQEIITDAKKTNKITVIPLGSYAVKNPVKTINDKTFALVGDASQAYPFFRAINNGLLLSTTLAECTKKAFETRDFASRFKPYTRYSTYRSYIETAKAVVKNIFIVLTNLWFTIAGKNPLLPVKMYPKAQKDAYQRGAQIWQQLTGSPPPTAKNKKMIITHNNSKTCYNNQELKTG